MSERQPIQNRALVCEVLKERTFPEGPSVDNTFSAREESGRLLRQWETHLSEAVFSLGNTR